jgi:hypothetical protein
VTITHIRACADCGAHVPADTMHTQHEPTCAQVDDLDAECDCSNGIDDVCDECCNVCTADVARILESEGHTCLDPEQSARNCQACYGGGV